MTIVQRRWEKMPDRRWWQALSPTVRGITIRQGETYACSSGATRKLLHRPGSDHAGVLRLFAHLWTAVYHPQHAALPAQPQAPSARPGQVRFKPLTRFSSYGQVSVSYEYAGERLFHEQALTEEDAQELLQGTCPVQVCVLPENPSAAMLVDAHGIPFYEPRRTAEVVVVLSIGLLVGALATAMLISSL